MSYVNSFYSKIYEKYYNQILKVVSKNFLDLKDISLILTRRFTKRDSLKFTFGYSIEKEFNIQLSIDDIVTVNNIKDLIKGSNY